MSLPSLSIIGGGKLGKTLGYLWQHQSVFQVQQILNRSLASSQQTVAFIGSGQAMTDFSQLYPADVFLLGCGDNQLYECAQQLFKTGILSAKSTVLHCSGALSSQALVLPDFISVASIHPIKSFADPQQAILDFAGTFCGAEGNEAALKLLIPAFEALGAQVFPLKAEAKTLYHAASVIACNYLVALEEISLQTFVQAGVERNLALKILQPIVQGTVSNLFKLDTTQALTGPIARGDYEVVDKQLTALSAWNKDYADIYRLLGKTALALSDQQGNAPLEHRKILAKRLQTSN